MSVASLYILWCSVFLYRPFCHGAHKLDLSTLLTTFFLWTSLPFILIQLFVIITLLIHSHCPLKSMCYPTSICNISTRDSPWRPTVLTVLTSHVSSPQRMADHQYGIHKVHGNYQRVFNEWSTIEKDKADPLRSAAHYMNVLVTYYLSLTFCSIISYKNYK